MDATKTNADGGGQSAFQSKNTKPNPTLSQCSPQRRENAAAMYAGALLRESRTIVDAVCRHGPGPSIRRASRRLRAALDSLDWVCDYAESEAQP